MTMTEGLYDNLADIRKATGSSYSKKVANDVKNTLQGHGAWIAMRVICEEIPNQKCPPTSQT